MSHEAVKPFQTVSADRFSRELEAIRTKVVAGGAQGSEKLSLREVISYFGPKGHLLLTLFFTLPFLQPIPIPGLSVVLGFCICFFGFDLFVNRSPYLPARIARIEVEKSFLLKLTSALESLLKKLEHVVRPRAPHLLTHPRLRSFHGFLIFVHAFLLALPLPVPFSNLVPALCLGAISLGSLEEDFAVVALGYVLALVNLAFFTALILVPFVLHRMV